MIGEVIGSYRIIRKLGAGGMGEVYLAEHQVMDRKAAIKILRPEASANAALVNRFFAEARASDLIKHPGIVQILDCATPAVGRAYIAMEYLEGETLGSALGRPGVFDRAPMFCDVAGQIADALDAAHAKGIVHRDLKPDNVFLTQETVDGVPQIRVKILDFGIAKLTYDSQVGKTQTGSILGTPMYMSPEQARGSGKVDHRSDIYSLGCIMFEMMCGRPPFVREGIGDLIVAHASEIAPFASSIQTSIPPVIDRLVTSMLAKALDARPQTMVEVAAVLAPFRPRSRSSVRDLISVHGRDGSSIAPAPRAPLSEERKALVVGRGLPSAIPKEVPAGGQGRDSHLGPFGTVVLPGLRKNDSEAGLATTLGASDMAASTSSRRSRMGRPLLLLFGAGFVGGLLALGFPIARQRKGTTQPGGPIPLPTSAPANAIPRAVAHALPAPPPPTVAAVPAAAPAAVMIPQINSAKVPSGPRGSSRHRRPAPPTTNAALLSARAAFDRGDFVAAAVQSKRAVREGGGAAAFVLMADSYVQLDEKGQAIEAYSAALEIDPGNAGARRGLRKAKKQ